MRGLTVAIADDSALFREGLIGLLDKQGVRTPVNVATGGELLDAVDGAVPDVVILDVRMPPTFTNEGIQTAAALRARHPDLPVLMLSTYAETSFAVSLLEIGTRGLGYLLKDRVSSVESFVEALTRLVVGESVVEPEIISRLLSQQRRRTVLASLTARELEVLGLMGEGFSNAGIGHRLFLSPKTVEANIAVIFQKLNLPARPDDNRRVLAVLAFLRHSNDR